MHQSTLLKIVCLGTCLSGWLAECRAVDIVEAEYQGRKQFIVTTETAVYYFDRAGGGFSRLIDRDGRDWIAFQKEPLSTFPDSAAAGYRGMPNCIFVGPDKGAGHPGFDKCESERVDNHTIRTRTLSGKWQWSWRFTESSATFAMEKAAEQPWWFLYEGPIAGTFEPRQKIWGTDQHGFRDDQPSGSSKVFGAWQRLYVADRRVPRALFIDQTNVDDLSDTLWYLGSANSGSADSPDGMVVVGFGRGPKTEPLLTGSGQSFTVGLVELPVNNQSDGQSIAADPTLPWSAELINSAIDRVLASQRGREDGQTDTATEAGAEILKRVHIWYGQTQSFGTRGLPQMQLNVLGSVSEAGRLQSLRYRIDSGSSQPLSLGSDLHRLARSGDFNIELFADQLSPGRHELEVIANWNDASETIETVTLELAEPKLDWPLPYDLRLDQLRLDQLAEQPDWTALQAAAQIIDGKWKWTPTGLRTAEPWYDRVLAVGDNSWTDYSARVWLTIHEFTPPQPGPPTYDVSHCGLALRWRGHTPDGRQPSRKWYPMGCQGELLLKTSADECQWRALSGLAVPAKPVYAAKETPVQLGVRCILKADISSMDDGRSRYRFKHWVEGEPEPHDWFVESYEPAATDNESGSFLVVPHNSDVTIHRIFVEPLGMSDTEPRR